jgi:hypothetical protein
MQMKVEAGFYVQKDGMLLPDIVGGGVVEAFVSDNSTTIEEFLLTQPR